MKTKYILWIGVVVVIFVLMGSFIVTHLWLRSLPSWQLSINRKDNDSIIIVNTTQSEQPIFTVIVKDWKISHSFSNLKRSEIVYMGEIETIAWDDTVPPGEWTLKIRNTILRIMPARLKVNYSLEYEPGSTIVIDKGHALGQKTMSDGKK